MRQDLVMDNPWKMPWYQEHVPLWIRLVLNRLLCIHCGSLFPKEQWPEIRPQYIDVHRMCTNCEILYYK